MCVSCLKNVTRRESRDHLKLTHMMCDHIGDNDYSLAEARQAEVITGYCFNEVKKREAFKIREEKR